MSWLNCTDHMDMALLLIVLNLAGVVQDILSMQKRLWSHRKDSKTSDCTLLTRFSHGKRSGHLSTWSCTVSVSIV